VKWNSISPRYFVGLAIVAFIGISLLFRIALPHSHIFVNDWVKYASNDSYSFMRMVDNWAYNFPHVTAFDVYRIYPGDPGTVGFSFFTWIITFVSWVIGLGSPSQHLVDVVGVYFPAVLAALTIIPAYFIGKTLFNRWAGVLAAGLMAVMPGEFLGRSILGFTDQHVAETLFSMTAVLFLMLAIKTTIAKGLTWEHFLRRDIKPAVMPLVYSALGGISLALYLLTWSGASLFIFIITLYFVIQFIIDHLRKKSSDYLGIVGFTLFLVSFVICLPFHMPRYIFLAGLIAMFVPPVLSAISRLTARWKLKPYYYPVILIGLGAVFIVIFHAVTPSIYSQMWDRFKFVFLPSGATAVTTMEMQPFLSPSGAFSTMVAWGNFTTSFFLVRGWPIPGFAMISFVILVWLFIKNRSDEKNQLLFFLWTALIFIATLVQRRFAYYLVVNISLLSAYISWRFIWEAGLKKISATNQAAATTVASAAKRDKKKPKAKLGFSVYHVNVILAIIVVFFFVFFWNITKSKEISGQVSFAPSDAWEASLHWMKDNTPDPFGDPSTYYKVFEKASSGVNFTYPASAYGVTAWWDYGYWISRTAHRLPNANPAQEPDPITKVARFFLSKDAATYREIRAQLDSSYVMIDYSTALSKFWAVVTWAGRSESEFAGTYYIQNDDRLEPYTLLYPEYYRTLVVRLYSFNGDAVTDAAPTVVTYEEKITNDGYQFRQITDAEEFTSYQDALDYISANSSAKRIIVGKDPFTSPIPLEKVPDYQLVYSSNTTLNAEDIGNNSEVKIFQYTGGD
jgi:oligosaccharyl transferase (archaeosortase A-associated)